VKTFKNNILDHLSFARETEGRSQHGAVSACGISGFLAIRALKAKEKEVLRFACETVRRGRNPFAVSRQAALPSRPVRRSAWPASV